MNSPLIKNGALSLTPQGLLQGAPDIETQMPVTISAYKCMYSSNVDSQLIPYFSGIPLGGFSTDAITNIVSAAYQPIMIADGLISDLTISAAPLTINTVLIKVNAIDKEGSPISLNWTNP